MTVTEAQRKRSPWLEQYLRDLDHRIRLQTIREDGARNLEKLRSAHADVRRAEERVSAVVIESAMVLARVSPTSALTFDAAERYHALQVARQGIVPADDAPWIGFWRGDIERHAQRLQVTILSEPQCAGINSYAWPSLRRIEIAPITSGSLYAVALHEIGHVASPCDETHGRKADGAGKKMPSCVRCELAAWRWAKEHALPIWTASMEACMRRSLLTYRPGATDLEQRQIDHFLRKRT